MHVIFMSTKCINIQGSTNQNKRRVIMVKLLTLLNYGHTLSKKTLNHNRVIYLMGTTKLIQASQSNT